MHAFVYLLGHVVTLSVTRQQCQLALQLPRHSSSQLEPELLFACTAQGTSGSGRDRGLPSSCLRGPVGSVGMLLCWIAAWAAAESRRRASAARATSMYAQSFCSWDPGVIGSLTCIVMADEVHFGVCLQAL